MAPTIGMTMSRAALHRGRAIPSLLGTRPDQISIVTASRALGTRILNLLLCAKSAVSIIAQMEGGLEGCFVTYAINFGLGLGLGAQVIFLTAAGPATSIELLLLAASNLVLFILVHLLGIALGTRTQSSWTIDATATYDPTKIGGIVGISAWWRRSWRHWCCNRWHGSGRYWRCNRWYRSGSFRRRKRRGRSGRHWSWTGSTTHANGRNERAATSTSGQSWDVVDDLGSYAAGIGRRDRVGIHILHKLRIAALMDDAGTEGHLTIDISIAAFQ